MYALLFFLLTILNCQLIIEGPEALKKLFDNDGNITASLSSFGRIPYGFTIKSFIHYDIRNKEADFACKPLNYFGNQNSTSNVTHIDSKSAPIALLNRGKCHFCTKVKNVQTTGAKAAIIINSFPGSINDFIMADDGTGDEILIPAVMISKEDGDKIVNFLQENPDQIDKVHVTLNFEMRARKFARIDLFYNSDNEEIYKLLNDFTKYELFFKEKERIAPHLLTTNYQLGENEEHPDCLSGGKYCVSPVNSWSGKSAVEENLRQSCIFMREFKSKNFEKYFEYMTSFYELCFLKNEFTKECSERVMDFRAIDKEDNQKCIDNTYKSEDKSYQLLDHSKDLASRYGITMIPSAYINGIRFLGSWNAETLFEALCSALQNKPEICYQNSLFKKSESENSTSGSLIVFIVLFIIAINVIIFIVFRKYISSRISDRISSNDMDDRITNVVTSYLAFNESK